MTMEMEWKDNIENDERIKRWKYDAVQDVDYW